MEFCHVCALLILVSYFFLFITLQTFLNGFIYFINKNIFFPATETFKILTYSDMGHFRKKYEKTFLFIFVTFFTIMLKTPLFPLFTQNTFNFEELNQIQLHLSNYLNAIYNNLIKFNIIIEVLNFSSENFDKFNIETSFNYLESNILSPDSDRNSAHLAVVLGASSSSETSESQENQEIERYSIKNWGNLLFLNDIKNTKNLGQLTNKMLIEFFNLELGSEISSKSDLFALHNQILISNNINSFENAVKNTKSLLSMLEKVKSIVINKSVAEKVDLAVRLLTAKTTEKGASNPSTSRLKIYENYLNANELITLANTDDSLLGLLYFPEDQKIGIYVPLFLPCGLSLLGAAKVLFHYFKDYRASLLVKAKVE